jgi:hypothetical protein
LTLSSRFAIKERPVFMSKSLKALFAACALVAAGAAIARSEV